MDREQLKPGLDVYASFGDKLGTVGDLRGDAFKVAASMMPDYWLPLSCVESVDVTGVHLDCAKDGVDSRKVDEPALSSAS